MSLRKELEEKMQAWRQYFEDVLQEYLQNTRLQPSVLNDSFRYSLLLGGKRVRPVLMFACAQTLGGKPGDVSRLALALEMIHTYSLIHDDLPAMDNDDFRRGQPSSHKKFGEGQAILAGDALLNEAYAICLEACRGGRTYLEASAYLCRCAGAHGMVAGQAADLGWQGREDAGPADLDFIILNKTARMLMAAAAVPAYVYGLDRNIADLMAEFGKNLGFLFQITDDILDVVGDFAKLGKTPGKDAAEDKLSAVSVYGLEKAQALADRYADLCVQVLDQLPYESGLLREFVAMVRARQA